MASRPAPRRSTKQDRDYLAYLRASNKNLTMADVYNYDQKFKEGVTNARALEGLTNYTPTISAEKVTDKSDPVSRGILNMQTQGRNMEGLFGNQVNDYYQKVDPAAQRKYRETFGRNPLYKFNVDKGSQHEFNIYENIQEPDMATAIAKGIPTDFATSVDKLARGVSGDRVDTSSLFTLGGRLANAGEFAYESRKGDRAGVVDDIQNAGNVLTYLVGGGGATLRSAALLAKLGKGYDAASTLSKASKMRRVTNPIDVGVPVAGQNASTIIDAVPVNGQSMPSIDPKAAGVAGGAGGAILAALLTKGKGGKVAIPAAAVGGAALASSAVPEKAQAANIKSILKAGIDSTEAARMINSSWSYRLKKDMQKWKDRVENVGASTQDFYRAGQGQRPVKPIQMNWSKAGIGEGAYSILPAKPVDLIKGFIDNNKKFIDDDLWDGEIVWGHDKAKSKGGSTTRDNVYVIPSRTNTKQGDRTFAEFIKDEFNTGNYASIEDVIVDNGLGHIPRSVLGIG